MKDLLNLFNQQRPALDFDAIKIALASPGPDPLVVLRRSEEAGDHQLPHLQARARRPVLRHDLRPDQGLRVPVRQVQAPEAPRRGLREVRHRSDPGQGAPRAHGPHRAGHPGRAHLVPEVAAVAHRPDAGHDPARHRAHPVLRSLRGDRAGPDPARARPAADRRAVPGGAPGTRRRLRRRMGAEAVYDLLRTIDLQPRDGAAAGRDRRDQLRNQAQAPDQAPQADRGVPRVRQPSRVDGDDRAAGAAAGPASAGAAGRRPLRDLRPERPVPPRHQPQQPPASACSSSTRRTSSCATRSACCRSRWMR